MIGPARPGVVTGSRAAALRPGDRVDAPAGQAECRTAGATARHRGRMAAAPHDAVGDPDLERVVEAVPDPAVAQLVAAQAGQVRPPSRAEPGGGAGSWWGRCDPGGARPPRRTHDSRRPWAWRQDHAHGDSQILPRRRALVLDRARRAAGCTRLLGSRPLTGGLDVESRESRTDGLRDVEGQGPVDRDEAVRDEPPGTPIAGLDLRDREVRLGQEPRQGRQVRVDPSGRADVRGGGG
jgi:hypothetical protein